MSISREHKRNMAWAKATTNREAITCVADHGIQSEVDFRMAMLCVRLVAGELAHRAAEAQELEGLSESD